MLEHNMKIETEEQRGIMQLNAEYRNEKKKENFTMKEVKIKKK